MINSGMKKRGAGLPIELVIVAAILVVLAVVVILFIVNAGDKGDQLTSTFGEEVSLRLVQCNNHAKGTIDPAADLREFCLNYNTVDEEENRYSCEFSEIKKAIEAEGTSTRHLNCEEAFGPEILQKKRDICLEAGEKKQDELKINGERCDSLFPDLFVQDAGTDDENRKADWRVEVTLIQTGEVDGSPKVYRDMTRAEAEARVQEDFADFIGNGATYTIDEEV